MGLLDFGLNLFGKLRLAAVAPSLDIAVEGSARLCTSDHIPIFVLGAPDPPPGPVHLDVSLRMWNKAPSASRSLSSAKHGPPVMTSATERWRRGAPSSR